MSTLKASELCRITGIPHKPQYDSLLLPEHSAIVTKSDGSLFVRAASHQTPRLLVSAEPSDIIYFALSPLMGRVAWFEQRRVFTRSLLRNEEAVQLLHAPHYLSCLSLSKNEQIVAAGGNPLTSERQEYEREMQIYEAGMPYDYGEYRPHVRPDPGYGPGRIRIWDVATGDSVLLTEHPSTVSRIALSESGSRLAAIDKQELRLWDTESLRCLLRTPKKSACTPHTILIDPKSEFVMVGDIREVWRYDVRSTSAALVLTLDERGMAPPAFDGAGRRAAVGRGADSICVYDNLSGAALCSVRIDGVLHSVALSAAGDRLAALVGDTFINWRLD